MNISIEFGEDGEANIKTIVSLVDEAAAILNGLDDRVDEVLHGTDHREFQRLRATIVMTIRSLQLVCVAVETLAP